MRTILALVNRKVNMIKLDKKPEKLLTMDGNVFFKIKNTITICKWESYFFSKISKGN